MELSEDLRPKMSIEMSTVMVVKNRCQFCYAFFKDREKVAEHSVQCKFRFSEKFEAFDGKVKFACAVCFDVFHTRAEYKGHERLHKFPGGFPCSACNEIFLNELECNQHQENAHEVFSTGQRNGKNHFACYDCGAFFEQESYLRLHNETKCGTHRGQRCVQCNLLTEDGNNYDSEKDDVCMFPKVEVTMNDPEHINPTEFIAISDINRIETRKRDPLLRAVKDTTAADVKTEKNRNLSDNHTDDIEELYIEENSNGYEPNEVSLSSDDSADVKDIPINDIRRRRHLAADKKFICDYCGKKYFAENRLKKHLEVHGPDFTFVHKCDVCPIYFQTTDERAEHKLKVHEEKMTCKICDKYFRTIKALEAHKVAYHWGRPKWELKTADDAKTAEENDCESTIVSKKCKKVQKHGKKFVCPHCSKPYSSKVGLKNHIPVHGPDGSLVHKCEFCPIYFEIVDKRDEHQMDEHEEKLTCKICNKLFRKYNSIVEHTRSHTKNGPKPRQQFVCVKCGVVFRTKIGFDGHEMSDCGRAPFFECDECGKRLSNKNTLQRHMLIHTNQRKYECALCHQKFRDKLHLTTHTRYRHTQERPYKCPYCEKCFVDTSTMKVHTIVHTGIKRYVCYGCGEKYPTNSALHKHRKYRKDTCALVPIQPPLESTDLKI